MTDENRKRILYVQLPIGGGSTISLYELVRGLDTTRYEPIVLFLLKNRYFKKFQELGVKTILLDLSKLRFFLNNIKQNRIRNILALPRDLYCAIQIANLIKKERIDLIHENCAFNRISMLSAWLAKKPQICHFRQFRSGRIPFFIRCLQSSITAVLYTTEAIANSYIHAGLKVAKKQIVYEPIDIQKFIKVPKNDSLRQQLSINKTDLMISNIGRITSWKGQHYFLQAIVEVAKQYPNIKVLIVGEPGNNPEDKDYLRSLQALVQQETLSEKIIFTGVRDDIPDIMSASDIVVHSSSMPEPFGLVIAEAMAAGSPVIATRGGGTPEIITDGKTGFLVEMKNVSAMKEAIQKLLQSESLRHSIGASGQESVAQKFSIAQHVHLVQEVYRDILTH